MKKIPSYIPERVLMIMLLLPAFWLNLHAPVDWGDDNFQYLSQARNLAEGIHSTETGFIYKDYARGMGPPAYPPGFSVLLAVTSLTGTSPYASALWLVSCCLLLTGFIFFIWSRRYLSFWASAFLVLLFIYNPDMIQLKSEIMSDIPFLCFLLLGIWSYDQYRTSQKWGWLVFSAITAGFSICIRSVGWVWVLAAGAYIATENIRHRFTTLRRFLPDALYISGMVAVFILVQYIWLPVDTGSSYGGQFFNGGVGYLIRHNIPQYVDFWNYYFTDKPVMGIGIFIFFCSMCGLWIRKKFILEPAGWFTVFHMVLLVAVWPHFSYRYFMPVLLFLLFFSIYFLSELFAKKLGKLQPVFWILLAVWVGFLYVPEQKKRLHYTAKTDGPFCPECGETWKAIDTHTTPDDVIAFHRPRAFYYLTRRRSFILPETYDPVSLVNEMQSTGSRYILVDNVNREYQQSAEMLAGDTVFVLPEWSNSRFALYRLR